MKQKKMKTNVELIRKMGNYEVIQRSKDGLFNATALLKQWNKANGTKKKLDHFFELKQTKAFIETLEQEISLEASNKCNLHTHNHVYVKSKASRGANAGTWVHPYLFIDLCLWLNPKFKLQVIKFVMDELVKNRHEAGIGYRSLSGATKGLEGEKDYQKMGKALNCIVFGSHERGIRNKATEEQLKELSKTQHDLATMIELDFINTFDELISTMRKMYKKKYQAPF